MVLQAATWGASTITSMACSRRYQVRRTRHPSVATARGGISPAAHSPYSSLHGQALGPGIPAAGRPASRRRARIVKHCALISTHIPLDGGKTGGVSVR